ncbi:hypothetical protein HDU93_008558 [Gonapodya sp. JEL0774]|nr:hypothetical protein HDU93_008558 [Gonapodya sp. JEL0774]
MANTIVVAGFGPGISNSVARHWGKLRLNVALVSRTKSRVDEGAAALAKDGINAKGFAADLADSQAVKDVLAAIKAAFAGSKIAILHWNAYGAPAGLLEEKAVKNLTDGFAVSVTSLVVAVQAIVDDLEATKGAVLVTGGGFGLESDQVVQYAIASNASVLAVHKSAQRKLVNLLNGTLKPKGVYAGEVTVTGIVKGTAWDRGNASLNPDDIAAKFGEIEAKRDVVTVIFG